MADERKDETNENEQTFYGLVKVSQNGQIIIPADLRKDLKIKHGDQLLAFRSEDGEDIVFVKMKKVEKLLKERGFRALREP
ncbi:MAG: AbrB/MazE/SpoVT family DNA-binding domain-containing protein [bacterium]|nr:AbrB/MazE/SpoVT family DNA-binding domain-containing protein [bacterium]